MQGLHVFWQQKKNALHKYEQPNMSVYLIQLCTFSSDPADELQVQELGRLEYRQELLFHMLVTRTK